MAYKVITAPVSEPLTLAEAKAHLRAVETDDEDAYITALIVAARQGAERFGRSLMPQTLELALDAFTPVIKLPRPPLISITSVKYLDESGVLQTMDADDYLLNTHDEPAQLQPAYGTSWPATRSQSNAVLIRYQAGYANAASVPQEIKAWMLLRIGSLYENREGASHGAQVTQMPGLDRLMDGHHFPEFA